MAQKRSNSVPRSAASIRNTSRNLNYYTYGNTVRKVDVDRNRNIQQKSHKKPTKKAIARMNLQEAILSIVMFGVLMVLLIQYIKLNADVNTLTYEISKKEKQLYELRKSNDEYLGRIESSIDLEKVREIAIMDLGMIYPAEGQIIYYESNVDDYIEALKVVE